MPDWESELPLIEIVSLEQKPAHSELVVTITASVLSH
jgi:hypothetical protein